MQNKNNSPSLFSRRDLLKTTGKGVTLATLASALGCTQTAGFTSIRIVGSAVLTILYTNTSTNTNDDDITFDFDYYRDRHLPLIMDLYGSDAIRRLELRKVIADDNGFMPPYVAAINIWIQDAEAFTAAGARHGSTLQADVINFTNTPLIAVNETVWGESGHKLESTELRQRCLTILYPWEEGARWDADYYRDHHMELIMSLYGTHAIRRFEVRKPDIVPNQNPPFMGTVNIYIENQAAFDLAGQVNTQTLIDDVANFSSVLGLAITTEIYGIG